MATVNSRTLDEILCSSQNPTDTLRKLRAQIYPSRTRVEINDKLIKYAFSLTDEGTEDLLEGEIFGIVEKRDYKNLGDIVTAYKILNAAGYTVQRPAREFDRDVLSVCISEQYAGNWCTTPPIIYRGLTGKVGKGSDAKPSKEQLAAIIDSVKFLMSRIIQYDASELCQSMNLNNRQPIRANDQLLPAWFIESSTANGNDATVIFFDRECPLMKLARAKKQILTYESHFLDVPRQQNTFMNIELKNYALRRVMPQNRFFVQGGVDNIRRGDDEFRQARQRKWRLPVSTRLRRRQGSLYRRVDNLRLATRTSRLDKIRVASAVIQLDLSRRRARNFPAVPG